MIVLTATTELFPQRGMKIIVRMESGQELALYKDSYALVIGNGDYPAKNGWNPLPGAVNDVKEVAEILKRHGFNVTLKIDVTKAEFNKAFSEFIYESGKDRDNRLLFYYAGHGYTTKSATGEDLGYLVMLDTPHPENAAEFDLHSVDMVKFVSDSKKIHAKHVLFMFDSCFSGTVLNLRNRVPPPHITDRIKNPVRQFITAGRADEPVPDRSEFKKAFLNLLEGRVQEPTPDGYLTGVELGDYLYRTVPKFSQGQHPQHGKIHDQQLNTGDFVFVLLQTNQDGSDDRGIELNTIATLNITSNPSGAAVYIDGALIGITPVLGHQIDTGARLEKQVNVGLELSGYKSRVRKVTLKGGKQFPWNVSFEKIEPEAVLSKSKLNVQETNVQEGINVNNEKTHPMTSVPRYTYLALMPGDINTIIPTNHHNNWGPFFLSEKTKYGHYYSLDGHGQKPSRSGWVRENIIYNKYDRDFRHWIYLHAKSTLVYDLSGDDYEQFHGYVGIPHSWPKDDSVCGGSGGSIEFTFLVDDIEVYKSGVIIGVHHNEPTHIEFDIPVDAQTLTLIVTDAGDGGGCDHWTLGDARLLRRYSEDVPIDKMIRETTPSKPKSTVPQTIIEDDIILNDEARAPSPNVPHTILGKDGAPMVLIPAGDFQMGHNGNATTSPVHTVYVDAFYIDVHEVTVGQYNQFVQETKHHPLPNWVSIYSPTDRHPVVGVDWHDAMAYAKWAGKRLPTEAEWEKAARGGLARKYYSWGDAPLNGTQCNFADKSLNKVWNREREPDDNWADKNLDDGYVYTAPVGSYPPNGYGLYDMAGNVWEWCFDAYDENFYANSPYRNPIAGITIRHVEDNVITVNKMRVARGNSWFDGPVSVWIASRLGWSTESVKLPFNIGFRCVKSVTP